MGILADLARMPAELEEALELFPEQALAWRPPSWHESPGEHFCAIEHVCHVRDIEVDGYHVRFSRVLQEDVPELASIDGHHLALMRKYLAQSPAKVMGEFRAARERTIALLVENWEQRNRQGTFADFGKVTFEGLAHVLRSHDLQHLAGMHWLHAKLRAAQA
jgi:hypothetical protein